MLSYLQEYPAVADILDDDHLRHWSPDSEQFTGCDALFALLQQGWQITGVVFCQEFWFSGNRYTHVYYFRLVRGDELTRMSVLRSPHVERYVMETDLPVFYVNRAPFSEKTTGFEARQTVVSSEAEKETVEAEQVICA